jgi:hypothetical protein
MLERKFNLTDPIKVASNNIMMIVHYVKVDSINADGTEMNVAPIATPDKIITVIGKELIAQAHSADYFAEEVKAPLTDIAKLLINAGIAPFTVSFTKADGEPRILRGTLIRAEDVLGRSYVNDLDIPANANQVRLVDHRTISFLIIGGVKYVVK